VNAASNEAFLRLAATVDLDAARARHLAIDASHLDWSTLPLTADAHGLVPLLRAHLTRAGIDPPMEARQQLVAGALQHRHANHVRLQVLEELLEAFDRASISVLVLKGAALAHVLYPSPDLRPMSDLDLLVDARDADRAQAVAISTGLAEGPRAIGHHHLPGLAKGVEGHAIHVEIHVDGVSRDTPGSITMRTLRSAPREFTVGARTARTFGHADMLYHLCRHTAERASLLRLIWIADIVGYAARYRDDIDWEALRRKDPFVLNALSLFHLVTSLPEALLAHVTPASGDGLSGIGIACQPLAEILIRHRSLAAIRREIFDPSDWWLRLYYGLGDGDSLAWHRTVTHPLQVAWWLARRLGHGRRSAS